MTEVCPVCQGERRKQARRTTFVGADSPATNRTRAVLAEHPDHDSCRTSSIASRKEVTGRRANVPGRGRHLTGGIERD